MRWLFILCFFLTFLCLSAQDKYERELRVKPSEVPSDVLDLVNGLPLNGRVKWYKELTETDHSFEAKTRHKRSRISIEFSKEGEFQDVEVLVKPKSIADGVFAAITRHLQEDLGAFSIEKVQRQYIGSFAEVLPLAIESTDHATANLEMVVSTRLNACFVLFEYQFTPDGSFLQRRRIRQNNSDNLEY